MKLQYRTGDYYIDRPLVYSQWPKISYKTI